MNVWITVEITGEAEERLNELTARLACSPDSAARHGLALLNLLVNHMDLPRAVVILQSAEDRSQLDIRSVYRSNDRPHRAIQPSAQKSPKRPSATD